MSTATAPDTGIAAEDPVAGRPRRRSRRAVKAAAGLLLAGTVVAASALWATGGLDRSPLADGGASGPAAVHPAAARPAAALPTVALVGAQGATVAWQHPLTLSVAGGTFAGVTVSDPAGATLAGAVGADGSWISTGALVPSTTYHLLAHVVDAGGQPHDLAALEATTTPPGKTVTVSLAPGDGAVVGVGQPLIVKLSAPVRAKEARAAVERNLSVTTVPAVAGAWRWMSDTEVHYRPPTLWAAGTKVTLAASMAGVQVGPDTWGLGAHTTSYSIGSALTSVVDTAAHTMTVSRDGVVQRVMRASMGQPQFPTRNGTFIVLEKDAVEVMDSATVNLPPGTPAYKTTVKDAVRLTNSGTFTHGAPWSVASQGVRNVSHGCVNLSAVDAHWYFMQVRYGDVVTVVNSTVGPSPTDAGSADWNMSFAQWQQGSALT